MIDSRKSRRASAAFFLRVGQAKRTTERRCEWAAPLFPLLLIMQADGTLTEQAQQLARKVAV